MLDGMSPRPRQTSDQEILAAAARVMQRLSPSRLTLEAIAREAGIVPATIVQRFGTKQRLILAVCRQTTAQIAQRVAQAREENSPLKALVELYVEGSSFASTPEAMANGLAYLQIDLTEPDFHSATLEQFRRLLRETKKLLEDAVAAGELPRCDTGALARLVQNTYNGSLLGWAIYRQGSLVHWVRGDLELLLKGFTANRNGL
jgi:AcrR family transcriptional regulator